MLQSNFPCILVIDFSRKVEDLDQLLKVSCSQFDLVFFVSHAKAEESLSIVDSFIRRNNPTNLHVFDISRAVSNLGENRAIEIVHSHELIRSLVQGGIVLYIPASSKLDVSLNLTLKNSFHEWLALGQPFGSLREIPGSFSILLESRANLSCDEKGNLSISFHQSN